MVTDYIHIRFLPGSLKPELRTEYTGDRLEDGLQKELLKVQYDSLHLTLEVKGRTWKIAVHIERLGRTAAVACLLAQPVTGDKCLVTGQLEVLVFLLGSESDRPLLHRLRARRDQKGQLPPNIDRVCDHLARQKIPAGASLFCSEYSANSPVFVAVSDAIVRTFFQLCASGAFQTLKEYEHSEADTMTPFFGLLLRAGDLSSALPKLELERVFRADAQEIFEAREKAVLVHHSGDIDAAGDEVEMAVRRVLGRKLSQNFHLGHGHIVDSTWSVSPQLDVIIADGTVAPTLLRLENGAEYFTCETVYAIGEIRSSYRRSRDPIRDFMQTIAKIRDRLVRQPPRALPFGLPMALTPKGPVPLIPTASPMFSFMLFVDALDFEFEQVRNLFLQTPPSELPDVVCFLNKGTIQRANISNPEADPGAIRGGEQWVLFQHGATPEDKGANFAALYAILVNHLQHAIVAAADLSTYFANAFTGNVTVGIFDWTPPESR